MLLFVQSFFAWLRRWLPWSNTRQAWRERFLGGLLLILVGGLLFFDAGLALSTRLLFWSLLLVAFAGLSRRGWVSLFGPVLFYDMIRSARRSRIIDMRFLYGVFLLGVLFLFYAFWLLGRHPTFYANQTIPPKDLADFASSFFYLFVGIQFLAIVLLTPAIAAGAIAEERERHTLDALFATGLNSREIVLGLLISRLATLGMIVLTGLPILSFVQFLGGIEPDLILAAYAATGITLASLAGLSFLNSLLARRPRDAVVRTYLIVFAYLLFTSLLYGLLFLPIGLGSFPSTEAWSSPFTLEDVTTLVNIGNPLVLSTQLVLEIHKGGRLDVLLPAYLRDYAWFHGIFAILCILWSVLRLRAEPQSQQLIRESYRLVLGRRPALTDRPVLWRELFVETGSRRALLGRLLGGLLLAAIFWPAVHLVYFYDRFTPFSNEDSFSQLTNIWVRFFTSIIGTFMLLQVAIRAAGTISGERDQQTLDGLLASRLRNRDILFGKWLGSVLGPRWNWFWLGLVWLIGLVTGALSWLAIPCFVGAWLIHACFVAAVGLWFSVASKKSRHATAATLLVLIVLCGVSLLAAHDMEGNWLHDHEAYCLLPSVAFFWSAFPPHSWLRPQDVPAVGPIVGELALWSVLALGVWKMAQIRFRVVTGREPPGELEEVLSPSPQAVGSLQELESLTAAEERSPALPSRLRLRWAIHLALLFLPLIVMTTLYVRLRSTAVKDLDGAFAETDRLDPNWRLDDMEAARKRIPDEENSYLVLAGAYNLIPKDWHQLEKHISDREQEADPAREKQLHPLHEQALDAAVRAIPEAIAEARRVADMPEGRIPLQFMDDGVWPRLEYTQRMRQLANVLSYDVQLRAQREDPDGALCGCRAIYNVSRTVSSEPSLISQLVRIAIRAVACARTERVLAQGQPSEAEMLALQKLLEMDDPEPLLYWGMRGERAFMDNLMKAIAEGKVRPGAFFGAQNNRGGLFALPKEEELIMLLSGSQKGNRADVLRNQNAFVEAAKLYEDKQMAQFALLEKSVLKSTPFVRFITPAVSKVAEAHRRSQAIGRTTAVALAAERFRRQKGRWPESLEELIPDYLEKAPRDPVDGRPVRLLRNSEGLLVYCVGQDGKDDGGKLDRLRAMQPGTDIGIQLFDVDKRRRPAGALKKDRE